MGNEESERGHHTFLVCSLSRKEGGERIKTEESKHNEYTRVRKALVSFPSLKCISSTENYNVEIITPSTYFFF